MMENFDISKDANRCFYSNSSRDESSHQAVARWPKGKGARDRKRLWYYNEVDEQSGLVV